MVTVTKTGKLMPRTRNFILVFPMVAGVQVLKPSHHLLFPHYVTKELNQMQRWRDLNQPSHVECKHPM